MEGVLLSEYSGADKYPNRTAQIRRTSLGYEVDLYDNEVLIETREVHAHSESYAEDVAENWTLGIIQC